MARLTPYEAGQVREIAAWKAERPSLLAAGFRALTSPLTRLCVHVLPHRHIRRILEEVEAVAEAHDGAADLLREAGAGSIDALRKRSLEDCDQLVSRVSAYAEHKALVEGIVPAIGSLAIPEIGEIAAAIVEVPIRLEAALKAIRRIGHGYGYRLDTEAEHLFVLGILELANLDDPMARAEEADRLGRPADPAARDREEQASVESIERTIVEDLPLELVPVLGEVSAIFLDHAFLQRVDVAARRVFQERRLREAGKVAAILPASTPTRRSALDGMAEVATEIVHGTGYAVGFGVTFPVAIVGAGLSRIPLGPVGDGVREGTKAAVRDAVQAAGEFRSGLRAALRTT